MGEIKAGVVVVTEFCQPNSNLFSGYINYIDRDEAIRNVHAAEFNIYQDYMGNPYKTTGLFTKDNENLNLEEKEELKLVFREAQENGSLMWQTVISFDNRWLKENGLWTGYLNRQNERKIQEVSRKAVSEMLESEGLENAVWSAAIHLNTDNIHVHIATVEPVPMRSRKKYQYYKEYEKNGRKEKVLEREALEYRGKFKMSSIKKCKSIVVNEIINQKEMNIEITRLIRESIVQKKREEQIRENEKLLIPFRKIYSQLEGIPKGRWRYNDKAMTFLRGDIDRLSHAYMELYHKEEFEELKSKLIMQEEKYRKGYGESNSSFTEGKIEDLYTRLGNAVLNELKVYDKEMKTKKVIQKEKEEIEKKETIIIEEQEIPEELWQKTINNVVSQKEIPETEKKGYSIEWDEKIREARALTKEGKKEKAANIYEEESRRGNVLAFFEMGQIYQYGLGREKNTEKADEYFKAALEGFKGIYEENSVSGKKWDYILSGYAAYKIGKLYEKGYGTGEDSNEALCWFEKGAGKQNCYAYYAMGNMYAHRDDMKDTEKAVSCFESAVEYEYGKESGYAHYQLGRIYLQEEKYKDIQKAEKYFLKSTQNGAADGFAYYQLGRMYQEEDEIRDIKKSAEYLERAMRGRQSKDYAAYTLGKIYLNEKEVRNVQRAAELFEKATENEEMKPHAFYQLGKIYREEMKDVDKAISCFESALQYGTREENEYVNYQLGKIYLQEEKYKDIKKAERYFLKSTKNGAVGGLAYYQLGLVYQEEGELRNIKKSVEYLEKAMSQKQSKDYAAYALGKIYLNEEKVKDVQKAVEMFEKAMENDEMKSNAFYQLGKIYKEHYRDKEKAIFNFEKAAEAGNPYAQKQIEFLQKGYIGKRGYRRGRLRREFSSQKVMKGLRMALDNEYESYKNQRIYLWNLEEGQRKAGMER